MRGWNELRAHQVTAAQAPAASWPPGPDRLNGGHAPALVTRTLRAALSMIDVLADGWTDMNTGVCLSAAADRLGSETA
jgi:hypothetical protein